MLTDSQVDPVLERDLVCNTMTQSACALQPAPSLLYTHPVPKIPYEGESLGLGEYAGGLGLPATYMLT